MKHRRLQELDRSDFGIVKGEPDIRGWDVRNAAGQKIGEVEELIIDAQRQKVRYMVIELDDDEVELEDDKRVLIPIGLAELDKEDDDVLLPSITVEHLRALPAYDENNLDEDTERQVCTTLGRQEIPARATTQAGTHQPIHNNLHTNKDQQDTQSDKDLQTNTHHEAFGTADHYADFYQHNFYNDDNLYKNRLHEAQPVQKEQPSDYEQGLRLWEMRSEGGVIPGKETTEPENREMSRERRMEMVQNRRREYEERRGSRPHKKDNTIIQRIKDEGLRDAGRP
ncbi:MAG: PRC-barrel domain-containing protein [Bacteroidota bacterium]|nr:PRC-barrel domain-containing protein [Bacteroidota bacterium]